ncbi:hypothetical protein PIB30_117228 [Stylosanthes scabra]|uniref:SWIM-type domain-containing protein n=1 Tax=Stylosanthes scabra TaxID=79078 RepID=A0ABU6Y3E8_9FABA|nr:hypothetical protein [Stylosanthes scabra]
MCNKKPSVVVTDGDEAMKSAIKSVFPDATHRLCAWHLEKNVTTNVRAEELRRLFKKWLYSDMEPDDFEEEWDAAMDVFGTRDRAWFQDTYEKRKMWANAYLKDKFCAGFRTTSRCEGINAYVKKFVKSRYSLLEMLQSLELMVREYRNNELEAQFKTVNTFPVMTTGLVPLERFAASVYTREVFLDVKKEIEGLVAVNFVSKVRRLTTMIYTLEGYQDPGRHIVVLFDRNSLRFRCPCGLWTKRGFPCRHMFFVMKHEHLTEIPEGLVLKRCRKDAKALKHYAENIDQGSERGFLLRHGALHCASQRLLLAGAKSDALYRQTINGLNRVCDEVEGGINPPNPAKKAADLGGEVRDPVVVKTKGAPRVAKKQKGRKRKCTTCRRPGHTKRHCKILNEEDITGEWDSAFGPEFASQGSSRTQTCSVQGTTPRPKTRSQSGYGKRSMKEKVDQSETAGPSVSQLFEKNLSTESSESDEKWKEMMTQISAFSDQLVTRLAQF